MTLILGDCIEAMREMPDASIDAIVTDPPYGLEFMGREWDHGIPGIPFFAEMFRVLKPGGHLLSFGGTRTYHRMTCAIEDAGFEIRDCLMWLYGSGFPKSMDVSKAIDKAAGAERVVVGVGAGSSNTAALGVYKSEYAATPHAATPEAEQWQGWGTALKPAYEPIVLARKPLIGTVAKNVLAHGTGALNIDSSRIAGVKGTPASPRRAAQGAAYGELGNDPGTGSGWDANVGRWPANVILDEEAGALLDKQTGTLASGSRRAGSYKIMAGQGIYSDANEGPMPEIAGSTGGASRFFYCAKASKSERNAGVDDKNAHPTVKPVALMRYLVRLITPPGGIVLDPFLGSGTTGVAALTEGFDFIGIERDPDYLAIAQQRLAHAEEAA